MIWKYHHNSFPAKKYTNRGIWQLKDINTPPPLIWKRKFKIRYGSTLRYKMLFWHLFRIIQTRLHAKGFVVPIGGTIVYRTFSNYNELCTKYHLLSMFFINVILIQQKVSCLQIVRIMHGQYILISLRTRRLHFSLSYIGQVCIIKRPCSFIYFAILNLWNIDMMGNYHFRPFV